VLVINFHVLLKIMPKFKGSPIEHSPNQDRLSKEFTGIVPILLELEFQFFISGLGQVYYRKGEFILDQVQFKGSLEFDIVVRAVEIIIPAVVVEFQFDFRYIDQKTADFHVCL